MDKREDNSKTCYIVGEGSMILPCAESWLAAGHQIRGLFTSNPEIVQWAEQRDIPSQPAKKDMLQVLQQQPFDYLFSIVNMSILGEDIISQPQQLAINFHDAYLPDYGGVYATSWALLNQEQQHGVTWHEMTPEADAGRILKQVRIDIAPGETAYGLNAKCYTAAIESFAQLVEDMTQDRVDLQQQDPSQGSYFDFYQRPAAACTLNLQSPARDVVAMVAALDFGSYLNPMGAAKVVLAGQPLIVGQANLVEDGSRQPPGSVLRVEGDSVLVQCGDGAVALGQLKKLDGQPVQLSEIEVKPGASLLLEQATLDQLTELNNKAVRSESFWRRKLLKFVETPLPQSGARTTASQTIETQLAPGLADADPQLTALAAVASFIARCGDQSEFDLGLYAPLETGLSGFAETILPLRVDLDLSAPLTEAIASVGKKRKALNKRGPYLHDLVARDPQLGQLPLQSGRLRQQAVVQFAQSVEEAPPQTAASLIVQICGQSIRWICAEGLAADWVQTLAQRFELFVQGLQRAPQTAVGDVPLLTAQEEQLLERFNRTDVELPESATVVEQFENQVAQTPQAQALICRDTSLTYAELEQRANQLAEHLRSLGVAPGKLVGIFMERESSLLVAVLATLKAGAAYVPLDPAYPQKRLQYLIDDARIDVLLCQKQNASHLPTTGCRVVQVDRELSGALGEHKPTPARAQDLCYVIYTSGSTGRPKGVMVEHQNAVNFFTAMDQRIGNGKAGTWLALTSLNFDISVLELLWTLCRGFRVVLHSEDGHLAAQQVQRLPNAERDIDFSAFFFASDGETGGDKYQTLLQATQFADANGFSAVWTPERHFHAFGGLFPNPSVTSAALATITKNISLRAGSCVLPLHSPLRVAEEWSVVDNLSHGRVAIAFASGWQPNDFVLQPDNYADRKQIMLDGIKTVQQLWRGDSVTLTGGSGKPVEVSILPRPVQKELPVWMTTAGNPESFAQAGKAGYNVLTHLLGQSLEEVAAKVAAYRKAYQEAGHSGRGVVSLMLHTFVGKDHQEVQQVVRDPMKQYLRSAVGLVKAAAWEFPTFKKTTTMEDGSFSMSHLSEEEMDALLTHAFERYYKGGGLFGSVEDCVEFTDSIKGIDVDEIACLIDFGIETDKVVQSLPLLAEVLHRSKATVAGKDSGATQADSADDSIAPGSTIPQLIRRYGVSHMQCTPSQAALLVRDDDTRQALAQLDTLLVGGEALAPGLAQDLRGLARGQLFNMYGPTETTVWSSVAKLEQVEDRVPLGQPVANTQLQILDRRGVPLPPGLEGELGIGGAGVTRGYLFRPELTAQRFIQDSQGRRWYRTGDRARLTADGQLEFLGRLDDQVKLRGHRLELGEIETRLAEHPKVQQAVVVVREDAPGDQRLVAYVTNSGGSVDSEQLKEHLRQQLPEYMVPQAIVALQTFPKTYNQKVDRKNLPAPEKTSRQVAQSVQPQGELEKTLAGIWCEVLQLTQVGSEDNFFDLGGHSLLTIQVHRRLLDTLPQPVTLVDLFRFPTIKNLAQHLQSSGDDGAALEQSAARAATRRQALAKRRRVRRPQA